MRFDEYVDEIKACFETLLKKVESPKESKLR